MVVPNEHALLRQIATTKVTGGMGGPFEPAKSNSDSTFKQLFASFRREEPMHADVDEIAFQVELPLSVRFQVLSVQADIEVHYEGYGCVGTGRIDTDMSPPRDRSRPVSVRLRLSASPGSGSAGGDDPRGPASLDAAPRRRFGARAPEG